MRNLDNLTVYVDNEGQPLYGRLTFYKLHTTDLQAIFDEDGSTPLPNPILTSQLGTTESQVFLQDADYTVKLEKFIGTGPMDPTDLSQWAEVRTFDSLLPRVEVEVDSEVVEAVQVPTVEALRQLPMGAGLNVAQVLGYYELGDMPPVVYKLERNASHAVVSDGGSIFRPAGSTTYLWRLVPPENIDVRIFGVMPKSSYTDLESFQSQLNHCFEYASQLGKDVYIPSLSTGAWYMVEGGRLNLRGKLKIDGHAFICPKSGTSTELTVSAIERYESSATPIFMTYPDYAEGSITVNCPRVKSSWANPSWAAWDGTIEVLELDQVYQGWSATGCKVEVPSEISGPELWFTDCMIESDHKLNTLVHFENCGMVSDTWLGPSGSFTSVRNMIHLCNMSSAQAYVEWKLAQGESNFGDLGEGTVSGITFPPGAIIDNAKLETCTIQGSTELHNVSGSVSIFGTAAQSWIDCWIRVLNSPAISKLSMYRGALEGSGTVSILQECVAENVSLDCQLDVAGGSLVLTGCRIHKPISHIGSPIIEQVVDCVFEAQVSITGGVAGAVVSNSIWKNNIGRVESPIVLNRSNLAEADSAHDYIYEGNTGTFLAGARHGAFSAELTLNNTAASTDNLTLGYTEDPESGISWLYFYSLPETDGGEPHGIPNIPLWRVGTDSFKVRLDWICTGGLNPMGVAGMEYFVNALPVLMEMIHTDDDRYLASAVLPEASAMVDARQSRVAIFHKATSGLDWNGATVAGSFEYTEVRS